MQYKTGRPFTKMHGLGNDFVVIDARETPFPLSDALAQRIADRCEGVGCDQLVVLQPAPQGSEADVFMHLRNSDGGEIGACGNATRCVAAKLMAETGRKEITIATQADLLRCTDAGQNQVTVDMGVPGLAWRDIPVAREQDTLSLDVGAGDLRKPVGVNMGNPHAVFFVPDTEQVPLAEVGPKLEHDPMFPERANISAAEVRGRDRIRLRVWERGAGITRACGTAACATAVAAVRRELCERRVTIELDGGVLEIEWRADDGRVLMTGPVAESFTGVMNEALLSP